MSTNNKISNLINSQVPFFVRNDHQNFVRFIEAYYEFLEQDGGLVDRANNIRSYQDIDRSLGDFEEKLYDTYLKLIPQNVLVDKRMLLKNVKDFYQSRGSEKSIRFLLTILFGEQDVEIYYPKKDVLRASDGKWYIQKSLRVNDLFVNGTSNNSFAGLNKFVNRIVTGNTSNASATVERVDRFFERGTRVDELTLTNIKGSFVNGEQVFSLFDDENGIKAVTANVFGGVLNSITITNSGTNYNVGDHPIVESAFGTGGNVRIDKVSTGNISSIAVIDGGAGFQNSNFLLFSGGGGTGANAQVTLILDDNSVHPNSYNLVSSTISLETNTPINNTIYSNLNSSIVATPNANTILSQAFNFIVYGNVGPVKVISVRNAGNNYTSQPTISIIDGGKITALSNTNIFDYKILGKMSIAAGGSGYAIGNKIEFINRPGSFGFGASGNVSNVDGTGKITQVKFEEVTGQIVGGSGYDLLPYANVISGTGTGANIIVTHRLGEGGDYAIANSTLGSIEKISILNRGSGYTTPPTINLKSLGDGTATANATIIEGVFTYPGRYLNDDGFLSSYNFIQDRDYYQNFSYVLRLKQSIANYRKAIKDLVHPAGMKLFGQYLTVDEQENVPYSTGGENSVLHKSLIKTYGKIGNTINVLYSSHGLAVNTKVYLEFTSGGTTNNKNGIYSVTFANTDYFSVVQPKSGVKTISIVTGGANYNANSYLIFSSDSGKASNGTFTINSTGSVVTANISDFGKYYNSIPSVIANGSNSSAATFTVTLEHYANTTSGNVNVSVVVV